MVMDWFVELKVQKELMDKELKLWLMLLLNLVEITGDNPTQHLKHFISGNKEVIKKYKKETRRQVCTCKSKKNRNAVSILVPYKQKFSVLEEMTIIGS